MMGCIILITLVNLLRVKSAFDPQVSSSLIVNSCNLKLGNCIGQGTV